MGRALELAERGWGRVAPNPMVGALVVRDGVVVAEGFHAEWGGPHAEIEALQAAGEKGEGATLYVNLEPCHHSGKTGPCSRAIAAAGIARVVCGTRDPNPEAAGGADWLREQGIEVDEAVCEVEARDLNAVHLNTFSRQRPFLALKYAISLDARLAEAPGSRTRVSEGAAIVEAHRLRAGYDAVLVGIGTALADDPLLTVREWRTPRVAPLRVVLDSALRLPLESKLVRTARDVPVRVSAARGTDMERAGRLVAQGVEVVQVERAPGSEGLDLGEVLAHLWESGVRSVLCEGGGTLGSALLAAGYVDRLYLFIAPRLFGEPGVPGFQGGRGLGARDWRSIRRAEFGSVTLLELGPVAAARGPAQP
ncbi:MAG: bifunctional diaminohydroxyphosphoribosylaminopyrimidine deaminase/5-amino-6-(5-phosphoribosylamino)uracil reductase RibD [Gemmatimonadota bacterium]|nr:MAG: bifunctional diaminohydroxyphosphoribosylaminopyrimidine deaminase/5-amino-6-(5-phosphoribosylamino)uracil reductase RibD [Gemmatimonadota bacterium]